MIVDTNFKWIIIHLQLLKNLPHQCPFLLLIGAPGRIKVGTGLRKSLSLHNTYQKSAIGQKRQLIEYL